MSLTAEHKLGAFLKERRQCLDPQSFGYAAQRRRTPGLRREEVAQRANISVTWYTWLEQGRGGAPSTHVLERVARALMLTETEREHLFLLALGHLPQALHQETPTITPRLQHILDALNPCPALIKNLTWDVLAWNHTASVVLTDYAALPPEKRNILRLIFTHPHIRACQPEWEEMAKLVVGAFRADVARSGENDRVQAMVQELSLLSPEFARLWAMNDVQNFNEGIKYLHRQDTGPVALDYSSFGVHGRPDLSLLVYSPSTPDDAQKIDHLLQAL